MDTSRASLLQTLYGTQHNAPASEYSRVASSDMSDLIPLSKEEPSSYLEEAEQSSSSSVARGASSLWPRTYIKDQVLTPLLGGTSDRRNSLSDGSWSTGLLHSARTSSEAVMESGRTEDETLEKLLPVDVAKQIRDRRKKRWRRNVYYALTVLVLLTCVFITVRALVTFAHLPKQAKTAPSITSTAVNETALQEDARQSGPRFTFGAPALNSACCNPTFEILPQTITPVKSLQAMSVKQLEDWIALGSIPSRGVDLSQHVRIDGVTMWVNGSDHRHMTARKYFSNHLYLADEFNETASVQTKRLSRLGSYNPLSNLQNTDNRYRELGELLYNVRSARSSLHDFLGTHHIISTDFWSSSNAYSSNKSDGGADIANDRVFGKRRGQVPAWLNTTSPLVAFGSDRAKEAVAVRMHHDWETFVPLVAPTGEHQDRAIEQWRSERLPTFSSLAAEAVLGINIPGMSEAFFLSSDDMLVTNAMSTADYYTPLFGPVLHVELGRVFHGKEHPAPGDEHSGHEYSVHLLRKRFGTLSGAYPAHLAKGQLQPIILESRILFRNDFEKAASRRFRGDGILANTHTLGYGTLIERHREALLWSFFVAKMDVNGDGMLSKEEFASMLDFLGVRGNPNGVIRVDMSLQQRRASHGKRHVGAMLERAAFPLPQQSTYRFSSFDGYLYTFPYDNRKFARAVGNGKSLANRSYFSHSRCQIELQKCLPRHPTDQGALDMSVESIFKRFAFEEHSCGSCLIQHLVGRSGQGGMEAFLPPSSLHFPAQSSSVPQIDPLSPHKKARSDYHLSLSDDWRSIDFSLGAVARDNNIVHDREDSHSMQSVTRRAFAAALIARYNYVVAEARSEFLQLHTPRNAEYYLNRLVERFENARTRFAFLCVNDNISSQIDEVRRVLLNFFVRLWPSARYRLPFELQVPAP